MALAVLAVIAPVAYATPPGYVPTGTIVADSGFRPQPNGFSFENYGDDGEQNLGPDEMIALFGSDQVCIRIQNGRCELTPVAEKWMESENGDMGGGHCLGFSVLSLLLWKDQLPGALRSGLPAEPTFGMKRTPALERRLAYTFEYQVLPGVIAKTISGNPRTVLNRLIEVLRQGGRETYTLGFWSRDAESGHAITPYAVESKGGGQYVILTYDNNYPGETAPFYVDTVKNTWRYDLSALNPGVEAEVWDGDARTDSMDLEPTTPGLGTQPCVFCAKSKTQTNRIALAGNAGDHPHMLITDSGGRRLGYVGSSLVNEIPGARVLPDISDDLTQDGEEPEYDVPVSAGALRIRIDGRRLRGKAKSDLTVIGPGRFVEIDDIATAPGETEVVAVGRNADWVRYKTGRAESPNIGIGFDDVRRVSWNFAARAFDVKNGSTLSFRVFQKAKKVRFSNQGGKGNYSLAVFRDDRRASFDWGANFDISGKVKATIGYDRRARDDNGKQGIPITWSYDGQTSKDALDRDYQKG
jgi:hypothetical protein